MAGTAAARAGTRREERLIDQQCWLEQAEALLRQVAVIVRAEREEVRRETAALSGQLQSA